MTAFPTPPSNSLPDNAVRSAPATEVAHPRYVILWDGRRLTYLCPECSEALEVVEFQGERTALCEECGPWVVEHDGDCTGDPPQYVDRTSLHRPKGFMWCDACGGDEVETDPLRCKRCKTDRYLTPVNPHTNAGWPA